MDWTVWRWSVMVVGFAGFDFTVLLSDDLSFLPPLGFSSFLLLLLLLPVLELAVAVAVSVGGSGI